MQRVKAPQKRHRVLAAMHEITQKVEQQKTRHQTQPGIGDRPRREADAQDRFEPRAKLRCRLKSKTGENQIEDPEPDIPQPPSQGRELSRPSRPAEFPPRYHEQTAEDNDEAQLTS